MAVRSIPVGTTFGRLIVIGDAEPLREKNGRAASRSRVICECGSETTVRNNSLKKGNTTSCGCGKGKQPRSILQLLGAQFGRLTVIGDGEPFVRSDGRKDRMLLVRCECGTEKTVRQDELKSGGTKSCGCLRGEDHGKANSAEYGVWYGIKKRCTNQNSQNYGDYGGRGITVCERWMNSFVAFLDDMGPRPTSEHSIERENNDGNYEPGNCRWATQLEQGRNKRNNRLFTFYGKTMTLAQWCRISQMSPGTVTSRLKLGWSEKEAFWTPVKSI